MKWPVDGTIGQLFPWREACISHENGSSHIPCSNIIGKTKKVKAENPESKKADTHNDGLVQNAIPLMIFLITFHSVSSWEHFFVSPG